ncbi:hypothetical protein [Arthrobacter sp. SDTb3-6]|uniref:hypothetical protein n=1 Tax=Arthrobacter sp. SDTb3-6 TaxID=2713571 RepID=UPI00159DBC1C|nr:hypothetical protein [Arthrobacter sp. SDTb3-6]NVN00542.1 hypothetical protein [Arthrobacter sp. SDTb3-6]
MARIYLLPEVNARNLTLLDLSSSWATGIHNPWRCTDIPRTRTFHGTDRLGKLATRAGIPFAAKIQVLAKGADMVTVGDRVMHPSPKSRH